MKTTQTYNKRKRPRYAKHPFCRGCGKFIDKTKLDAIGREICPKHGRLVRHKPRSSKYRKIRNNTMKKKLYTFDDNDYLVEKEG